jgi:hypothetical protein
MCDVLEPKQHRDMSLTRSYLAGPPPSVLLPLVMADTEGGLPSTALYLTSLGASGRHTGGTKDPVLLYINRRRSMASDTAMLLVKYSRAPRTQAMPSVISTGRMLEGSRTV